MEQLVDKCEMGMDSALTYLYAILESDDGESITFNKGFVTDNVMGAIESLIFVRRAIAEWDK